MSQSKDGEFSRAGDVLKDLFEKIVPEETRRSAQVLQGWEDIVGSETAMHVVPLDVRNQSLLLECDHPGWSQKIRMEQETILRVLRQKYPELEIRTFKITVSDGRNARRKGTEALSERSSAENVRPTADSPTENGKRPRIELPDSHEDKAFFELLEEMHRRSDP